MRVDDWAGDLWRGGVTSLLASRRVALVLLATLALLAVPGTLGTGTEAALRRGLGPALLPAAEFLGLVDTYRSPLFLGLLGLLALNILFCTWRRLGGAGAWRRQPRRRRAHFALDAAVHLSLLAILAGGGGGGLWGFVRTRNLYVGERAAVFYDFRHGADLPLGFTLEVLERRDLHYPLEARIGVSDRATGAKLALLEVREGRATPLPAPGSTVTVDRFDADSQVLRLTVAGGEAAGALELEAVPGGKTSAPVGRFDLTLVAWKRDLMRVEALISCSFDGFPPRAGWVSPQEGLDCGGVRFALTAWGTDPSGRSYVGLQAVSDPTAPLFWAGCVTLLVSLPIFLAARWRGAPIADLPAPAAGPPQAP